MLFQLHPLCSYLSPIWIQVHAMCLLKLYWSLLYSLVTFAFHLNALGHVLKGTQKWTCKIIRDAQQPEKSHFALPHSFPTLMDPIPGFQAEHWAQGIPYTNKAWDVKMACNGLMPGMHHSKYPNIESWLFCLMHLKPSGISVVLSSDLKGIVRFSQ